MNNFKKVMKIFFSTKILVIVLIFILLLVVILPASYYFITIDDAMWDEKEKGKPSNYTKNVEVPKDNTSDGLTIDKTAMIKQALTDIGYEEDEISNLTDEEIIDILGLNKKIRGENNFSSLDDVTEADVLWCMSDEYSKYLSSPEELEKLLNAEIITQYPKMGQDDSKLDGIIQFERHKTDGTTATLTYVDKDTFSSYVQGNDTKALDYFTLDDQGNAMIAYSNSTTETVTSNYDINVNEYTPDLKESDKQADGTYKKETVTVEAISINYKMTVQKYTMPFQYLWALLVVGEDKDFVLELADLVENSEITISIYDNITTIEDVNTYKFKKETRTDKMVNLFVPNTYGVKGVETQRYWLSEDSPEAQEHYDSKYGATYEKSDEDYTVTHSKITKTNSVVYDLTKANVWIVDYSKEYSESGNGTPTVENNSVDLENTDYALDSANSKNSAEDASLLKDKDAVDFAESTKKYIEGKVNKKSDTSSNTVENSTLDEIESDVKVSVSSVTINSYEHKIERKQENTVSTTTQKYVAQTPTNRPKVDRDADEDNFVTLLCKSSHKKAKKILTGEVTSWLMEVLEKNEDTVDKVDLTKYLFYKVTGKDYGVTEYDFGEYVNNSFNNIGISVSSNILFDYLASWENAAVWKYLRNESSYSEALSKYITEDKTEYICYKDKETTRNFGFGVCHTPDSGKTYWHLSEYQEEGITINSGQYDTVGVSKISVSAVDNVKTKLLNGYQESIKKQLSDGGILEQLDQPQIDALTCIMYQYGNIGNFVEAYKTYGNTEDLIKYAKSNSGKTYFNSNVENNGRSQANWTLFHEGKYIAGTKEELSTDSYSGSGKILEVASQIWKVVCTSGKFVEYGGIGTIPSNGPNIDCSGFVSWVLYEAGYKEEFYYQHDTSNFLNTNWNARYGWEEIEIGTNENPYDKLQPGDILVRNEGSVHHMNVVAEVKDGKLYAFDCGSKNSWINNSNGEPVDRSYFLTSNARGKIIRITQ